MDPTRRQLVQGLAVAAGFLMLPGAMAVAQGNARRKLYAAVLNSAIATRDIRGAVKSMGRGPTREEANVLMTLTLEELVALGGFRARMNKLGLLVPNR